MVSEFSYHLEGSRVIRYTLAKIYYKNWRQSLINQYSRGYALFYSPIKKPKVFTDRQVALTYIANKGLEICDVFLAEFGYDPPTLSSDDSRTSSSVLFPDYKIYLEWLEDLDLSSDESESYDSSDNESDLSSDEFNSSSDESKSSLTTDNMSFELSQSSEPVEIFQMAVRHYIVYGVFCYGIFIVMSNYW